MNSFIIDTSATVKQAIEKIDMSGKEIVLVCENNELRGIVTDSDIRRGILRGVKLDETVLSVINVSFRYAWIDEDRDSVFIRMKRDYIRQMPVLDENRRIVDIYSERKLGSGK
jgi:CBS domain-containing protein